ncbi:sterol desaturase [Thecamonas trahens ATCC 50062]|uniref:Sterol desaturase n=1 Tax=Thecamonas trahens ATCC 50062 TaxID=461836 RepID=A0A0L0DU00_THETB|nr:sterol desaturase [Thecamonas trahens ATCC 50062]KNC55526.1 sterol desaturase [Thecamonas trahens ATCC 50062]|eukprot:XP_013761304.1 sterol desaturase [Thecamonas trahens ATCC 50062]
MLGEAGAWLAGAGAAQWGGVCAATDRLGLYVGVTQAVICGIYYGLGAMFLVLDLWQRPQVLYACKLQGERPFVAGGSKWNPALAKLAKSLIIGYLTVILPANMVLYALAEYRKWGVVAPCGRLPTLGEFVGHLAFCVALEEILFYYGHRALHKPGLYKAIHKQHHEFIAPIALAANYAHPIEVLLSNVLPLMAGPVLIGAHIVTMWTWFAIAIVGTLTHHCGYRFPWHPLFDHQPNFHDTHHERFLCNYGLLGILDWLHGTYRESRGSSAQVKAA